MSSFVCGSSVVCRVPGVPGCVALSPDDEFEELQS